MHLEEKLTVTWKVHCVTAHLSSFLSMHGRGMDDVCEQVGEASHHAMKPVLQTHKVAEDNPKFLEKTDEGSGGVQQLECF